MNVALRVMVTAEQRQLIEDAAKAEGLDTAAWVRPILLEAAKRTADEKKKGRSN
jgi:uncharacterized protein (DUF1778 family)